MCFEPMAVATEDVSLVSKSWQSFNADLTSNVKVGKNVTERKSNKINKQFIEFNSNSNLRCM